MAIWTVQVGNSGFEPEALEINCGDVVHWVWIDGRHHTVTADDGSFDSGITENFVYTFETAGTFPYHDKQNSGPDGIHGVVTVT